MLKIINVIAERISKQFITYMSCSIRTQLKSLNPDDYTLPHPNWGTYI